MDEQTRHIQETHTARGPTHVGAKQQSKNYTCENPVVRIDGAGFKFRNRELLTKGSAAGCGPCSLPVANPSEMHQTGYRICSGLACRVLDLATTDTYEYCACSEDVHATGTSLFGQLLGTKQSVYGRTDCEVPLWS